MSRADKVGEHKGKDMSIILVLKGKNKGRKTKIILIIESLCGNWISIHPAPEALSTVGMSREQSCEPVSGLSFPAPRQPAEPESPSGQGFLNVRRLLFEPSCCTAVLTGGLPRCQTFSSSQALLLKRQAGAAPRSSWPLGFSLLQPRSLCQSLALVGLPGQSGLHRAEKAIL